MKHEETDRSCGASNQHQKPPTSNAFRVIGEIASHRVGTLWKACNIHTNHELAVMRPHPKYFKNQADRESFIKQIVSSHKLSHPNIVKIEHIDKDEAGLYYIMEYVEGRTLEELVDSSDNGLPLEQVNRFVLDICHALQYAHGEGIVHGDINPSNILIDKIGNAKLVNIGLAGFVKYKIQADHQFPFSASTISDFAYIAPEQIEDNKPADMLSDQYSLAVVIYYMLTGKKPKTIRLEQLPVPIIKILSKALDEKPSKRYKTIEEFAWSWQQAEKQYPQKNASNRLQIKHTLLTLLLLILILSLPVSYFFFPAYFSKNAVSEVDNYIAQSMELLEHKQYTRALTALNAAESLEPQNREVQAMKGRILYLIGEQSFNRAAYADAVSYYRNALSHDRDNLEYAIKLSISYFRLAQSRNNPRHYNDALQPLWEMSSRGIVSEDLYLRKGYIFIRMGNVERAINSWQKVINEFPDSEYAKEAERNLRDFGL